MTHMVLDIQTALIVNCATIAIILGCVYCCKLQVEHKLSIDGMITVYSILIRPPHF